MKPLRILATLAMILAFFVVMLGAYTRLTNAGLGCPDWPGCYGRLMVPVSGTEQHMVQQQYPNVPLETTKAWTEMLHRYVAGTLVLLIVGINLCARRYRRQGAPRALPLFLLGLIGCQATLGMWTVTLKLLPVVVMGHLLGGLLLFGGLVYLNLLLHVRASSQQESHGLVWVKVAVGMVFCQIALGGWVSANYAGLSCMGFPQCNGHWLPTMIWQHSFQLWSALGTNYQGGLLDSMSRVTIQMVHRFGAAVTLVYLLSLAVCLFRTVPCKSIRYLVSAVLACLLIQIALGITNVVYWLPLWVAVAHNGMAALLFAAVLSLHFYLRGPSHARYA